MAPQRKTTNNDDNHSTSHRDSGNGTKDKTLSASGGGVSKSRKPGGGGSTLKEISNASALTTAGAGDNSNTTNGGQGAESGEAIKFASLPRHFLHAYRNAHHLPIAASFSSVHNETVLANPGSVGLRSPTMNRAREKRRVSKEALGRAVRRDFMDQSVNELDVEANACYIIRNGDKAFRMRFVPQGKKQG